MIYVIIVGLNDLVGVMILTTLHSQISQDHKYLQYGNTDGPNIVYLSPLSSPVGLVIEA